MSSFKINKISSNADASNFNHQSKCVKDSVLTLEEAVKLLEKECIDEMHDKCKMVIELEKEGKIYESKLKEHLGTLQEMGPNEKIINEISSIIGNIGQIAKEVSELLIILKDEEVLKESSGDLVKLVELNESITRSIYLNMKSLEDINDEKINKFSKRILKKKKKVGEIASYILDNYSKEFKKQDSSENFNSMLDLLKKIPEDGEKVILVVKRRP